MPNEPCGSCGRICNPIICALCHAKAERKRDEAREALKTIARGMDVDTDGKLVIGWARGIALAALESQEGGGDDRAQQVSGLLAEGRELSRKVARDLRSVTGEENKDSG